MSPEDARLAFERHSTSKIQRESDLEEISTLGFRGEALPSISTVSRVVLTTYDGQKDGGILVEREGEKVLRDQSTAFPQGTSITVTDLFFNLPARRKFLGSERSELGKIVRYLTAIVLAYPEVRFSLTHAKREIFHYPGVASLKERIFQVYGKSVAENLLEVDFHEGGHLYGYISKPPSGRRDRRHQHYFINRRPVRDKILQAAVSQAFRGRIEKELFPQAFLLLYLPYSEVDVNVHPAKNEVRFRDSQKVFQLVSRGIQAALAGESGIKTVHFDQRGKKPYPRIEERRSEEYADPSPTKIPASELFSPPDEREKKFPYVFGQYLDMYIVASNEEGIFIIDQHNAHEKVLFEKYKEIDAKKKWPIKLPLFPLLVELSPSQDGLQNRINGSAQLCPQGISRYREAGRGARDVPLPPG
jgi:DNA mismatch repair protein MutL